MADLGGQQFGDYRLLRHLGSGTFGEVYEGEQIYLKTHVAIKVLHAQLDQAEREQFLKEARIIASLEHPHIARVLSFSIQQHISYLVMQLAQSSLKNRFGLAHPQPIETILPYFQQAAEGLQYAHDRRVMHLDIKPANLLLTAQEQVLLADFGLAMELRTQQTHQTLQGFAGTPAYAAPEQFQNKPCLASDQYALGALLYQWLTGTLPFEGDWLAIGHQKVNQDCPSLHAKVKSISPDLESVVLRALARDPKIRFASVSDFATVLSQAVERKFDAATRRAQSSPSVITSPSTSTPSSTKGTQTAGQTLSTSTTQAQPLAPLDGETVLRKARVGDVPPSWRIFSLSSTSLPGGWRFAGRLVLGFLVASIGTVLGVSLSAYHMIDNISGIFLIPLASMLLGLAVVLATTLSYARKLKRKEDEKRILVLLPEGYVYGTTDPPQVESILDFQSASAVQAEGKSVHITLIAKGGIPLEKTEYPVHTFRGSFPPEVALTIAQAYLDFEKHHLA